MPRVIGDRIVLREYQKEDLVYMRKWVNDETVVDNLSDIFLFPHTVNFTETFLNQVLTNTANDRCYFVIADKQTDEYIGQIDLIQIDWKNRVAEVGIVIGSAENRGKGFGSEALKLVQRFVFDRLNLNRLEIKVRDFNERAFGCYLKSGFNEEGRLKQNFYVNGRYYDTICLAMMKEEYLGQI